jgi:hypothetical protein
MTLQTEKERTNCHERGLQDNSNGKGANELL